MFEHDGPAKGIPLAFATSAAIANRTREHRITTANYITADDSEKPAGNDPSFHSYAVIHIRNGIVHGISFVYEWKRSQ